jgi:eukaryotic-like serine/threonine-protein kinase
MMQADNWKTIKNSLLVALKLDPSKRREYLEQAGLSAEVRAEVESLLTHDESAQDFMSLTASGFTREFLTGSGSSGALINQKIDIYEVVSELGLGGMGAVYLAMRRDGKFEQRVAIKMLKREFNTKEIRRNFQREKEILARLSHPNIASLLDAGTTEDGIPYLVMEYIEGEPIDSFCQNQKVSLNSKLKLFNRICETVAFAHRSLIIHRDLKPSNILVTKHGEPKLLDFGISKLLDAEGEDLGAITHLGAMTPLYASPEQIKGGQVTTATDVYSLGVVLFKILTGRLPSDPAKGTNGNHLTARTHTAVPLPSKVAIGSAIPSSDLKGDLDNIVLKSLNHEPERRYQSVEQFSADIWRFMDGMPVVARPATLRYRASKFYGRNKIAVIAAALIVISLLSGVAVALSQAKTAREQARIAGQERDAARRAVERAERTSRFMQSFLDYANPRWYGRGQGRMDVTVREAIDDAAKRIDTELSDLPEVRADLHYTIGDVYKTHGDYEASNQHMRQSLELYREAFGEQHPKVARGIYYVAMAMKGSGSDVEEVKTFLSKGILMMRQTDPENLNLPYMLQLLAHWDMEEPNPTESQLAEDESLLFEAKTLFTRHYGKEHVSTIAADRSLANLALKRGDLKKAEEMWEEIVERFRKAENGREAHIWALSSFGGVKLALGKGKEAQKLFGQALGRARTEWGTNDAQFKSLLKEVRQARATVSWKGRQGPRL